MTANFLFMDGIEVMALAENRFRFVSSQVALTFDETTTGTPNWMSILVPGAGKPDVFERIAEFQPTSGQLAGYAGAYVSDEIDPIYRIVVENGGLELKRLKVKPQKLRPIVEDYFQGLNGVIHFQRDSAGKVTGFVLNGGRIKHFRFRKTDSDRVRDTR
jgi:hypothetical protein